MEDVVADSQDALPNKPKTPTKPSRSTGAPLRELPTGAQLTVQYVTQVKAALNSLMYGGAFLFAADLVDQMLGDGSVATGIQTRLNGVFGSELELGGKAAGADVQKVADGLRGERWTEMFPEDQRNLHFTWGIMLGVSPGYLDWRTGDDGWVPRLSCWHPRNLIWRWDTESYWMSTYGNQVQVVPGDRQWCLYTPFGFKRGWSQALVRRIAVPWLCRQYALRDWARYSEIHGMPTRKALVPFNSDKERQDDFLQAVINLANEPCILLERGSNGEVGYDLEFLEAASDSYQGFEALMERCETDIAKAILGQNLTSEVQGGSFAAAKVHDDVRLDYKRADSNTYSECLYTQALKPYALLNFGDEKLAPRPSWQVEPAEDMNAKATTLQALGIALTALKAVSDRVDVDEVLEEFAIPLLTPAQAAAVKQERQGEAQAQAEAMGALKPTQDGTKPPAPGTELSLLSRLAGADTRWQTFVDAVGDYAKGEAVQVLSGDLAALKDVVKSGASYEDIRHRLVKAYEGMDPERLALLTQKVLVLSRLAGRTAILEGL